MTAAARIEQVVIILVKNKRLEDGFGGSSQGPLLRDTLLSKGALFGRYYGTDRFSLDCYISGNGEDWLDTRQRIRVIETWGVMSKAIWLHEKLQRKTSTLPAPKRVRA